MNRLAVLAITLTALALTACGDTGSSSSADAGSRGFPVSIKHSKGTATIPERPKRVVALGYTDVLVGQALGADIVGVAGNPTGSGPRKLPLLPEPLPASVKVLNPTAPQFEQIAALRPDLILATTAQPSYGAAYDRLAQIAPTVSSPGALLEEDPATLVRTIGRALGRDTQARDVIRTGDEAIATFAREHPNLRGLTYAFGQVLPRGYGVVVGHTAISSRFFRQLGLGSPPELARLDKPGNVIGQAMIGAESSDLIGRADVAFISTTRGGAAQRLRGDELLQRSRLARDGDLHTIDVDTAFAIQQAGPVNAEALLRKLGPALAKAGAQR